MAELLALYDALKSYPTLQLAVGALIVLAGVRLMLRAEKDKAAAPPPPAPGGVTEASLLHFQGPMAAHSEAMREIRDTLRDQLKEEREQTALLREIHVRQAIDSGRREQGRG